MPEANYTLNHPERLAVRVILAVEDDDAVAFAAAAREGVQLPGGVGELLATVAKAAAGNAAEVNPEWADNLRTALLEAEAHPGPSA